MKTQTLSPKLDVVHDIGLQSNTFRATHLNVAMRVCADWLQTQPNIFVDALTTYWDGDADKWAVRVVYSGNPLSNEDN